MYYGSPFYIVSLVALMCIGAAAWLLLRKCKEKTCRTVILTIMLLNLFQHLFKPLIYPQYSGAGFTSVSTAYNMCATLIILSPLAYLSKSRFLKNFVYFTGAVAGIAAIAVPYWFIGCEVFQLGWEYIRFYLCHALLFLGSVLPLLLGLHRPSYREFWHIGTGFLLALCIIFINDFVCMAMGIYPGASIDSFYQSMQRINPCGMMGPPEGLPWLVDLVKVFSPAVFMGENPAGLYVPILWYAVPLFVGLSVASAVVFSLMDRENFSAAWKRLCSKRQSKP